MKFLDLAKERYSVRSFKTEQVKDEDIKLILEAGRVAPTAKNNQPQKIYVVKSKENVDKLSSICKCIYGAPCVLVVGYDKDRDWKNKQMPGYSSGETDSSIVLTHMMLQAWEIGVGSVWVGMFNDEEVRSTLNLPSNIRVTALMPIGYPSENSKPIQMHFDSRKIEDIVEEL